MSYADPKFGHPGYFTPGSAIGTFATTRVVALTTAGPTVVGFLEAGGKQLSIYCISAVIETAPTVTAPVLTFYRIIGPATAFTTTTYSAGTMTFSLSRVINDVVNFYPTSNNVLNPGEYLSAVCTTAATAGKCVLSFEAYGDHVNPTAVNTTAYPKPVSTGALGGIYVVSS